MAWRGTHTRQHSLPTGSAQPGSWGLHWKPAGELTAAPSRCRPHVPQANPTRRLQLQPSLTALGVPPLLHGSTHNNAPPSKTACLTTPREMMQPLWETVWRFLKIKNRTTGASLVAQWLRVCLLMQGTRVRALVWEDPTCRGATGPVSHNY